MKLRKSYGDFPSPGMNSLFLASIIKIQCLLDELKETMTNRSTEVIIKNIAVPMMALIKRHESQMIGRPHM